MLQIPLVGIADELEARLLEGLDNRVSVGPTALPSAVFYTFVNSHHTLNCVTSSSDGACVAGQHACALTGCSLLVTAAVTGFSFFVRVYTQITQSCEGLDTFDRTWISLAGQSCTSVYHSRAPMKVWVHYYRACLWGDQEHLAAAQYTRAWLGAKHRSQFCSSTWSSDWRDANEPVYLAEDFLPVGALKVT